MSGVEFVVARYKEDLSWVREFAENEVSIKVYDKGGGDSPAYYTDEQNNRHPLPTTHLENMGRETDTYLRHIIDNYENLSAYTVFLQGFPHEQTQGREHGLNTRLKEIYPDSKCVVSLLREILKNPEPVFSSNSFIGLGTNRTLPFPGGKISTDVPRSGNPDEHCLRVLWDFIFQNPILPPTCSAEYFDGAMFIVPKETILKRSKQFYINCLDITNHGGKYGLPEDPYNQKGHAFGHHYTEINQMPTAFERMWPFIFNDKIIANF